MCFPTKLKKCTKCQKDKSVTDFSKKQTRSDGSIRYESQCRECRKRKDQARYLKNKKLFSNEKLKKNAVEKQIKSDFEFTFIFSLAKEGPDLKGAIDICMNQLKHQEKA